MTSHTSEPNETTYPLLLRKVNLRKSPPHSRLLDASWLGHAANQPDVLRRQYVKERGRSPTFFLSPHHKASGAAPAAAPRRWVAGISAPMGFGSGRKPQVGAAVKAAGRSWRCWFAVTVHAPARFPGIHNIVFWGGWERGGWWLRPTGGCQGCSCVGAHLLRSGGDAGPSALRRSPLTCLPRVDSGTARMTAPGRQWGGPEGGRGSETRQLSLVLMSSSWCPSSRRRVEWRAADRALLQFLSFFFLF